MLWISRSVTAFGNAPSISRNSADTTFFCRHACLMVLSSRCNKSSVDLPGRPLKWVLGKRLWVSRMKDVRSATKDLFRSMYLGHFWVIVRQLLVLGTLHNTVPFQTSIQSMKL